MVSGIYLTVVPVYTVLEKLPYATLPSSIPSSCPLLFIFIGRAPTVPHFSSVLLCDIFPLGLFPNPSFRSKKPETPGPDQPATS